jgi:D-psicose/D-tagatose/L-ribulose 3-epimerase
LLLDTFHMNIEEDFIGDSIRSAAGYIGHFHIGETNRKTPGLGHMPWTEIADALADIEYSGRVVMEPFVRMGGSVGRDIKSGAKSSGTRTYGWTPTLRTRALSFNLR